MLQSWQAHALACTVRPPRCRLVQKHRAHTTAACGASGPTSHRGRYAAIHTSFCHENPGAGAAYSPTTGTAQQISGAVMEPAGAVDYSTLREQFAEQKQREQNQEEGDLIHVTLKLPGDATKQLKVRAGSPPCHCGQRALHV